MLCLSIRTRFRLFAFSSVVFIALSVPLGATQLRVETGSNGAIETIESGGVTFNLNTDLRVAKPGWKKVLNLDDSVVTNHTVRNGTQRWSGYFRLNTQADAELGYVYEIETAEDEIHLDIKLHAETDLPPMEGVFLLINFPVSEFKEGVAAVKDRRRSVLPRARAWENPRFLQTKGSRLRVISASRRRRVKVDTEDEMDILVQDGRVWGVEAYQALIRLHPGTFRKGETKNDSISISPNFRKKSGPVSVNIDHSKKRGAWTGFGGNFVFGVPSPEADFCLRNLSLEWGRTQMDLKHWEPRNDNDDPQHTDWTFFQKRDRAGSPLRTRLTFDKRMAEKMSHLITSVWYLPSWLGEKVNEEGEMASRRVKRDQWPELIESICSYLRYQKKKYGVEPDFFSFNEPALGVHVKFSWQRYTMFMEKLLKAFRKHDIGTELLVPDTANGNDQSYGLACYALSNPVIRKHTGAIGFHVWHNNPENWSRWRDLADNVGLPLVVAEIGAKPGVETFAGYNSFWYTLEEIERYQQVLTEARPETIMQWQCTDNYGVVKFPDEKNASGERDPQRTMRYWALRQYAQSTPPGLRPVPVQSEHPAVKAVAFMGRKKKTRHRFVVHITNKGSARDVRLSGIPKNVGTLKRDQKTWSGKETGTRREDVGQNGELTTTVPADAVVTYKAMF